MDSRSVVRTVRRTLCLCLATPLLVACVQTGDAGTSDAANSGGSGGGSGGVTGSGGSPARRDAASGGSGGSGDTDLVADGGSGAAEPDGATASPAGSMRDITSMALVKEMGMGWNLGNTLDAIGGETAWGNPLTTEAMIRAIAASGFKSMRIPVTWRDHFGPPPSYAIDAAFMNRVQQIVDWALGAGLYAIINLHHDGGEDFAQGAWIRKASTDHAGVLAKYQALWTQIAARFKNHGDRLVFESMNEVGFDDLDVNGAASQAAYDLLNGMNAEFVRLIRASGGNNGLRHLLLAGYWTDIERSVKGSVMPADRRTILSIHYYTPYQFCINGSPSTWGSTAEVSVLKNLFGKLKTTFVDKGVPVILGEFGAVRTTQASSRIFWLEYVVKVSTDHGIAPFLWDNGTDGEFDRASLGWRTPGLLEALQRASSGVAYTPVKDQGDS